MNVFLSTSLFSRVIDGKPDVIDIHYRRGWSLVPGHVHATGLSIRGRDGNVEWILRLDEVEFDVSFAALARQRFEASHVYGSGASFRARLRLDAPPRSAAEVADLPPIEGLGPFALRPPPHPEPEVWSDPAYHLWSARLEDVVARDVREVWIDDRRFEGSATITGRFYLKPIRQVEIGPIRVDVAQGRVRKGSSVVVERLEQATVDLAVAPFDPRTMDGPGWLRRLALKVVAHPACAEIGRLPLPLPEGVALTGPADVRRLVMDLRGGELQAGTAADVLLSRAAVMTRGVHRFGALVHVTAGVARVDGKGRLDMVVELTDLDVERTALFPSRDELVLHVPRATVVGESRALDLASLFADVHLVADASGGELPDVRALSVYIPPGTPLATKGGKGQVTVHLEAWRAEQRVAGRARLDVEDFGLRLGKMRMRGTARIDGSFGSYHWHASRMEDAVLSLRLAGGALASERRPETALVRARIVRVDASAAEVVLEDPLRALGAAIALEGGEVVDPDLLREYVPKGTEMHLLPGRGHFSLACQVTLANHLASGTLDATSKQLAFSFRDFHVGADVRAKARVHAWQWERGDLALDSADVDVTDVRVDRPDAGAAFGHRPSGDASQSASAAAAPALSVDRIVLGATSRHFSFADPLQELRLSASLLGAKVHDSAIINDFLPAGAPFAIRANEGGFSSEIHAMVRARVLDGIVDLHAQRMGIGGKSFAIGGDIDVRSRVSGWDFATNVLAVDDAHVLFSDVSGGAHPAAPGQLDAAALSPGEADFRAERVELWASTPRLDLVKPSHKGLDARLVITAAELPDATALQRFMPPHSILAIDSGGARVSGSVEVSSTKRTAQGRLDVDLARAGIRFNETHLVGNFALSARLLGYDPDRDFFDVSGSRVAMRDVQVTNASTTTQQWQGDAVLDQASFRLAPEPELEGKITVEALDASPILAILLGNGLPKIFVGLTRMPHLSAAGTLTMGARRVALRDLDAHGGDLSIEGIYVLGQSHRAGAFVVGKGPFSAGFRLDDKGAHLRLFGLDGWLREETRASLRLFDEPPSPQAPPSVARP